MFIDESLMTAKVYYKKPGMDFYLVAVSMPDIGQHINSIIVDRTRAGELRVKPPKYMCGKTRIQQVEFDRSKELWPFIERLVLDAVKNDNGSRNDAVIQPSDDELNNPEKGLDDAIANL